MMPRSSFCSTYYPYFVCVNMYTQSLEYLHSMGLYCRRRQTLSHAFIRLSNAYKSVLRHICLYFSRRHQRASTRARKRSSVQDATKFNGAELSRFTPANASNPANHLPLSRIEFAADRSCNYVRELALDNQLVASES